MILDIKDVKDLLRYHGLKYVGFHADDIKDADIYG